MAALTENDVREYWHSFYGIGDLSMTFKGGPELWHYFNSAECSGDIVTALCGESFNESDEEGFGSMWVDPYNYIDFYNATPDNTGGRVCAGCIAGFVKATDEAWAAIKKEMN